MSQWTSKYDILRDLSVAQGRVPVRIERTVGAGDKPPSLNINEETEEEFFKHCSADADVSAAPDLFEIQQMLHMVREIEITSDDEDEDFIDKAVTISKLNVISETTPNQQNANFQIDQKTKKEQIVKPLKKRQVNIAIESILRGVAKNEANEDVVLLKPTDFITTTETKDEANNMKPMEILELTKAVVNEMTRTPTLEEKVNGWLETRTSNPFPKKTSKVLLEPSNIIFKKKNVQKIKPAPVEKRIPSVSSSNEYKPSELANKYYLEYIERKKFKEAVHDTIWTKAEKKMKEINEKRRREAAQAQRSPSSSSHVSDLANQSFEEIQNIDTDMHTAIIVAETKIKRCLDKIGLSQHRHKLTGPCVVCKVMSKKPTEPVKYKTVEQNEEYIYTVDDNDLTVNNSSIESTECHENEDAIPRDSSDSLEKTYSKDDVKYFCDNIEVESKSLQGDAENEDLILKDVAECLEVTCTGDFNNVDDLIFEDNAQSADENTLGMTDYVKSEDFLLLEDYVENIDTTNNEVAADSDLIDFSEDVPNVYECIQNNEKTELTDTSMLGSLSDLCVV